MTESNEQKQVNEGCCGEEGCECEKTAQCDCAEGKPCEEAPEEPKEMTVEELQSALKMAEAKVLEHYDLYVRAMAELENTRRRAAEDVQKARKFSIEKFAENLLPVVDSLEKALEVTKDQVESPIREGMETTYRQMLHALDVSAMAPIDPKGEAFDPHTQQAIAMVPAPEGVASGTVVEVFQRGWKIADRVLRPAMVSVAQ
jgi:molecular chaperone GrpE